MALWPFRRRSGRKRSRSGALSDVEGAPPTRSQTEGVVARAGSKKKQRTEPTKLHRRARTYSFSPGRDDSIRVDHHRPGSPAAERTGRSAKRHGQDDPFGTWDRTPTLHHRRSTHNHSKAKGSRQRRRHDHKREAEIKALSNFEPVRPATDQWFSGRPMKKDSKRAKTGGLGRPWETSRASEVSLPVPGSIHSSLSSDSEYGSYKVSALDVLAPRPTLRYTHVVRAPPSHLCPHRSGSQKQRVLDRQPIPEETMRAHKRIDDLADNLDSSGLRELMERDKRRREKKRQTEQERMERRLAKRAEKQKAEELEAKKSGTPPPENLERGVLGRELVGLGIEPKSAVVTSSKHRYSGESVSMRDADADNEDESPKKPYEAFHRTNTAPSEEPTVAEEETSRRGSTLPRKSDEQASISTGTKFSGLLRSVKTRSKSTLGSERDKMVSPPPGTIDEEDGTRKDSESSTKGGRFSISSFLRWGGKSRGRQDSGPSSFSNTSREEMQAAATAQAQAQALAKLQGEDTSISETYSGNYLARKNSAPKRTRSRFREDLPEFPVSPPASRVQSPEAEPPMPKLAAHKMGEREPLRISAVRYDTPSSARPTPTSMERGVYASPSPEPHMSMSLASIDSEGSWLSGNVGARKLAMRESLRRANRRDRAGSSSGSPTNSTQEDLAITEDEYLSKLTPRRNSSLNILGRRSGEGRPSSDEGDLIDDVDMKWGAVGSHPQVVHSHTHDRLTMKSHEGLLDMESDNEDSENSPVSPTDQEIADVRRARSVNLGKGHVRNFSAGSAKLLEISPRASVDDKRRVSGRRGSAFAVLM